MRNGPQTFVVKIKTYTDTSFKTSILLSYYFFFFFQTLNVRHLSLNYAENRLKTYADRLASYVYITLHHYCEAFLSNFWFSLPDTRILKMWEQEKLGKQYFLLVEQCLIHVHFQIIHF